MLKKAFTLIELLVVIAIIAILTAGGVVMYTTAKEKAHDSNRLTRVNELALAIDQYIDDNGKAPVSANFYCLLRDKYLKEIPKDPQDSISNRVDNTVSNNSHDYRYLRSSTDQTKYELSVKFAAGSNADKMINDGGNDGTAADRANARYEIGTDKTLITGGAVNYVIYNGGSTTSCPSI